MMAILSCWIWDDLLCCNSELHGAMNFANLALYICIPTAKNMVGPSQLLSQYILNEWRDEWAEQRLSPPRLPSMSSSATMLPLLGPPTFLALQTPDDSSIPTQGCLLREAALELSLNSDIPSNPLKSPFLAPLWHFSGLSFNQMPILKFLTGQQFLVMDLKARDTCPQVHKHV